MARENQTTIETEVSVAPYRVDHFINGKRVVHTGRTLALYDPALGKQIGEVRVANAQAVDQAVQAAKAAFPAWSAVPPLQRAKMLFRFKILLEQNRDQLAQLVTREHGKTLKEAHASLQRGIDVVDFACGTPERLKSAYANDVGTDVDCYSLYQPLGVCVGITPFNFPAMVPLWMFPLAIACGNTFILKPSEKDPSCGLRLVELIQEAGAPDGVVNVVQGDKETVDALLTHPDVRAVSFVGSSQVAEHIYQTATAHGKRAQAFGGAKNHCVVMPDANLDQAAEALVASAYDCAGERCMAISVVIAVGDMVADALIEKMKPRIARLKMGPGTAPDVQMGPLVTAEHWQKVKSYIELGKQEGAVLVVDGSDSKPQGHEQGFFMGGCLFDHVTSRMRIYREEIFGPVLSIVRVANFSTALTLVNEHEYGNGTAIFTSDGYTARRFAHEAQVGMVGVNVPVPVPVAHQSFGGWKRSVFADLGMYGNDAVRFYTKFKTITQRWFSTEQA
jgi:malonate-semialdehyde dehydrogenase (acetylating)/methylmalonate-semialdehyde dehydrogenase